MASDAGASRSRNSARRYPVGAEITPEGASFRIWAPTRERIEIVIEGGDSVPLERESGGCYSGTIHEAGPGTRYRLDDDRRLHPDPAPRFQPEGPHGAPLGGVDPFAGATRAGAACDWTAKCSTGCMSAPSRRRHLGGGRPAPAAPGGDRRHDDRDDAGRRLPREFRLERNLGCEKAPAYVRLLAGGRVVWVRDAMVPPFRGPRPVHRPGRDRRCRPRQGADCRWRPQGRPSFRSPE